MDIGCALHDARERQGLTLQQISDATKISTSILTRIERNEFSRLPGSVFTKGYLRAYAGAVGISSEPLVQAYTLQTAPAPIVEPRNVPQARAQGATWRIRVPASTMRNFQSSWPLILTTAAAIAVIVVLYGAVTTRSSNPSAASTGTAGTASARAETDSAPAATGRDSAAATGTSGQQAAPFPATLAMNFTKQCWVGLTADGQSIVYRLVQPGETVTARADNEMVVRIGDPTAFTYTLNGAPGHPVGKPGMPVRFRINRDTYADLIGDRGTAGAVRP
jgi:cytoskeletal protein RodZ